MLCLGHPFAVECEGYDRFGVCLPADQEALAHALAALEMPVVVVLTSGAPLTLGDWHDRVAAVLLPGFGGQAGGAALADVLLGVSEPAGRLTETWPVRLADSPALPGYPGERGRLRYGEGVFMGYRWYDALDREVAYPFGHGLGYADIVVTDVSAQVRDAARGDVHVRVSAVNRSERAGSTVVQLYVGENHPLVPRPPRELRGFHVLRLDGGASGEVTVDLAARDFAFFDVVSDRWQRKPGVFTLYAGTSSRNLPATCSVVLTADPDVPPLVDEAALAEWIQRG